LSLGRVCFTGWRRPTGFLIFIGHFPQKNPIICGLFAKNDLHFKTSLGSSPPFTLFGARCSVLQDLQGVMNILQVVADCCRLLQIVALKFGTIMLFPVWCVLQGGVGYCRVWQGVLQGAAGCGRVLHSSLGQAHDFLTLR